MVKRSSNKIIKVIEVTNLSQFIKSISFAVAWFILQGSSSQAKNLGVQGHVFTIVESNLLETIHTKLKQLESKGILEKHQKLLQHKTTGYIEQPSPVGLPQTTQYRSHLHNPAIVVEDDIVDHRDNIIAAKGTTVNPLGMVSFGTPLVFINGDHKNQVDWAMQQDAKIVLTGGKPLLLAKNYNKPIYFDQGAVLTKRFDIRAVPARVSQQDQLLLVEEINLKENFTHE